MKGSNVTVEGLTRRFVFRMEFAPDETTPKFLQAMSQVVLLQTCSQMILAQPFDLYSAPGTARTETRACQGSRRFHCYRPCRETVRKLIFDPLPPIMLASNILATQFGFAESLPHGK
jgi:hypothetical protein